MHSDQKRKYGITKSMIQALYYDIVGNKVIIGACIMDYASNAWCIMRFTVYPGLVSCPCTLYNSRPVKFNTFCVRHLHIYT